MLRRRVIISLLLLVVGVTLCGAAGYLHERVEDQAQHAGHPGHDHDHCAVCQLLGSARLDRLPQTAGQIVRVDLPPRPTRPVDQAPPEGVTLHRRLEARGPPRLPHV